MKRQPVTALRVGLAYDARVLHEQRYLRRLHSLDLLTFPELIDGGYASLNAGTPPRSLRDPLVQSFREASRRFSLTCIAGSLHLSGAHSTGTNTSLVFGRGRLMHRYDKMHLFRPTGDHRFFSRGKSVQAFRATQGQHLRAGVIICYDLRFPELIRRLARQGMQVLVVPARWPRSRDLAWRTLLRARAIENQLFVVGCNARGQEGGFSYVFDPLGALVYSSRGRSGELLATVTLDLRTLNTARAHHDNLADAVLLK